MAAMIIRKQATCMALRTGVPSGAFNPIFIKIKELPQIKAKMINIKMERREMVFN
jgi:hypothetical protein